MKKLFLALIFLLVASISYAGAPPTWTLTALNTSTYTAIQLPDRECGAIVVYSSDGQALLIAKDAAGKDERPMLAGVQEGWSNTCENYGSPRPPLFYVKATTGTPNLILLFQNYK